MFRNISCKRISSYFNDFMIGGVNLTGRNSAAKNAQKLLRSCLFGFISSFYLNRQIIFKTEKGKYHQFGAILVWYVYCGFMRPETKGENRKSP